MHKILAVAVGPGTTPPVLSNVIQNGHLGTLRVMIQELVKGLKNLGHRDGVDFDIDYVEGDPPNLKGLIRGAMKAAKPDLIFTVASSALQAARAATTSIPIVFAAVSDPIEQKAVKSSCGQPGTNATGIRTMLRHTAPDCLDLFKAMVPSLKQVYALHQPKFPSAVAAYKRLKQAGKRLGVAFAPMLVRTQADIAERLRGLSQAGPTGKPRVGILVPPDDLVVSGGQNLIQIAHSKGIPTFFPVVEFVNTTPHSALGAYGIPSQVSGEAVAYLVHKILKGANPRYLPVKRAGGFEWAVNKAVAEKLNITIPAHILQAADRVV